MKIFIKTILLFLTASALIFTNLSAEVDSTKYEVNLKTETFYFPAYDNSMDSFWSEFGVLDHDCSATSWLGHVASASCKESQNCVCRSNFLYAACDCVNPTP